MMTNSGLLLVDKQSGCTSHDVVAQARKVLQTREVGHAGTLDPLASGLMVLLIGQATRLSDYLMEGEKSYEVHFKLGVQTDTLDAEGEVTAVKDTSGLVEAATLAVMHALSGEFEWDIPMYSAKKVQGKKLYEYARQDQVLAERPKKRMDFVVVDCGLHSRDSGWAILRCSKGSFIRSWVDELGKSLGVGGHVTVLRRLSSGHHSVKQAVKQSEFFNLGNALWNQLIRLDQSLPHCPSLNIHGRESHAVLCGRLSFDLKSRLFPILDPERAPLLMIKDFDSQNLLALVGCSRDKGIHIRRVFPSSTLTTS